MEAGADSPAAGASEGEGAVASVALVAGASEVVEPVEVGDLRSHGSGLLPFALRPVLCANFLITSFRSIISPLFNYLLHIVR